jgi:hypothetical protein
MKTQKRGDAMGRASWRWSFLGDPGARFFGKKRCPGTKREENASPKEKLLDSSPPAIVPGSRRRHFGDHDSPASGSNRLGEWAY